MANDTPPGSGLMNASEALMGGGDVAVDRQGGIELDPGGIGVAVLQIDIA